MVWRIDTAKKPAPTPPTPGGSPLKHYSPILSTEYTPPHRPPLLRNAQKPPYFPLSPPHPTYDTFLHIQSILPLSPTRTALYTHIHPTNILPHPHRSSKQTYPFVKPIQRIYPRSVCWNKNIPTLISFLYFTHIYTVPTHCKNTSKNSRIPYGQSTIFSIYKNTLYPAIQAPVQHLQKNRNKKRRTPFLRGPYPILLPLFYTHIILLQYTWTLCSQSPSKYSASLPWVRLFTIL